MAAQNITEQTGRGPLKHTTLAAPPNCHPKSATSGVPRRLFEHTRLMFCPRRDPRSRASAQAAARVKPCAILILLVFPLVVAFRRAVFFFFFKYPAAPGVLPFSPPRPFPD